MSPSSTNCARRIERMRSLMPGLFLRNWLKRSSLRKYASRRMSSAHLWPSTPSDSRSGHASKGTSGRIASAGTGTSGVIGTGSPGELLVDGRDVAHALLGDRALDHGRHELHQAG